MAEIVLTRIDDRLIHGQVMTAWVKKTHANHIIVIDDKVAKDDFMIEVLKMSAPTGIKVDVFDSDTAITKLQDLDTFNDDKIIILVKEPLVIEKVIVSGINISKLIIGGMGARKDRQPFYRNIAMNDEEKKSLQNIIDKGVKVTIHIIPDQKEVDAEKYLH